MLTPAAKRRRVAAANETLKKPFKSPLVNRGAERGQKASSNTQHSGVRSKAIHQQGVPCRSSANAHSCPRSGSETSPEKTHQAAIASRREANANDPGESGDEEANSLLIAITKHQADVDCDVKHLNEEIEQASKPNEPLRTKEANEHGRESELSTLTAKWRRAARMAAEELFPPAKERYLSFGGRKGLKQMQRRQAAFFADLDADEIPGSGGLDEARAEECENEEEEEEEEEEEFTMGRMLKSMNIEFDLMGYDPIEDGWKD